MKHIRLFEEFTSEHFELVETTEIGTIPMVGDDVRGFGHKYGTRIKKVYKEGRRFQISAGDYWDSKDCWHSFDEISLDTEDKFEGNTWKKN